MSKNWQRPSRRDALLQDRVGAYAIARHVRMSPQKVRRVVDMVRGMSVTNALDTLRFAPQAASEPVYKVIASAVANAESTENLRGNDLYVSQLFVDEGVTMRRIRARAKGSASRILKRASHITAVVEPEANRGPIPPSKQVVTMRLDAVVTGAAAPVKPAKTAKTKPAAEAAAKAEAAEVVETVETVETVELAEDVSAETEVAEAVAADVAEAIDDAADQAEAETAEVAETVAEAAEEVAEAVADADEKPASKSKTKKEA